MSLPRHLFYWLRRLADPPDFVLTFTHGTVRCTRGEVRAQHLADCQDVADEFGITSGHVEGLRRAGRMLLRFSPAVPRASHQRLWNVLGNTP